MCHGNITQFNTTIETCDDVKVSTIETISECRAAGKLLSSEQKSLTTFPTNLNAPFPAYFTANNTLLFCCDYPRADCNRNRTDGCEISLDTDGCHCGSCDNDCSRANVESTCINSTCNYGECDFGWDDCDFNKSSNGCEHNVTSDFFNCGACGNVCQHPHISGECTNATCIYTTCDSGWGNCDSNITNGCELNITSDVNNCGACGNVCPAAPNSATVCSSSSCSFVCDAGWSDCDGNSTNGCEINRTSDVNNCGTCGNVCPAVPNASAVCSSSSCSYVCDGGWVDCDTNPGNGCEQSARKRTPGLCRRSFSWS